MSLSTCEHCGGHIPLGLDASNRCGDCGKGVFDPIEPKPPIFCETGTMIRQNLPRTLDIGYIVDAELPPGTIEFWQDGKRIGRIENVGVR